MPKRDGYLWIGQPPRCARRVGRAVTENKCRSLPPNKCRLSSRIFKYQQPSPPPRRPTCPGWWRAPPAGLRPKVNALGGSGSTPTPSPSNVRTAGAERPAQAPCLAKTRALVSVRAPTTPCPCRGRRNPLAVVPQRSDQDAQSRVPVVLCKNRRNGYRDIPDNKM